MYHLASSRDVARLNALKDDDGLFMFLLVVLIQRSRQASAPVGTDSKKSYSFRKGLAVFVRDPTIVDQKVSCGNSNLSFRGVQHYRGYLRL